MQEIIIIAAVVHFWFTKQRERFELPAGGRGINGCRLRLVADPSGDELILSRQAVLRGTFLRPKNTRCARYPHVPGYHMGPSLPPASFPSPWNASRLCIAASASRALRAIIKRHAAPPSFRMLRILFVCNMSSALSLARPLCPAPR